MRSRLQDGSHIGNTRQIEARAAGRLFRRGSEGVTLVAGLGLTAVRDVFSIPPKKSRRPREVLLGKGDHLAYSDSYASAISENSTSSPLSSRTFLQRMRTPSFLSTCRACRSWSSVTEYTLTGTLTKPNETSPFQIDRRRGPTKAGRGNRADYPRVHAP